MDYNTKPAYCPKCKWFGECYVEPDEYDLPCDAFEEVLYAVGGEEDDGDGA